MALEDLKITETDLVGKGVSSLTENKYVGDADMLKARFDSKPDFIIVRYNELIDLLAAVTDGNSGADNIGATPILGGNANTVQGILEELLPKSGGTVTGNLFSTQSIVADSSVRAKNQLKAGTDSSAEIAFVFSDGQGRIIINNTAEVARFSSGANNPVRFPTVPLNTTTSTSNVFISSDGKLQQSTSSKRWKDNICDADIEKAVEVLKKLKVRNFTSKCDGDDKTFIHTGGIAEEFYKICPELAIPEKDENGHLITENNEVVCRGIEINELTYRLLAGWQAQQKQIDEQQTQINDLTKRIEVLEKGEE